MSSRRHDNGSKRRRGRRQRRTRRPTEAVLAAVSDQVAAGARGDTAGALAAFRRRGYPPDTGDERELEFLDRLGADAPDWLVARWACETAYGWMLESQDPRIETATMAVAATHDPPPAGAKPAEIVQRLQLIATYDEIVRQLALFELGGLADFADVRAEPPLAQRAPRFEEWAARRWGVFEQVRLRDDVLRVRDTVTREVYDVLHIGAANGVGRDVMLFGHVAPTNAEPGWVFVHRPMAVDPRTADDLAAALRQDAEIEEVMACVGNAACDHRIAIAPGMRLRTWLWSDTLLDGEDYAATSMVDGRDHTLDDRIAKMDTALREIENGDATTEDGEPGRLIELRGAGVSDDVAVGIMSCETALLIASLNRDTRIDGGRELAAVNAANNMWWRPIVDGVREHATPPGSGPLWRDVATCVAEPFRSRCLEFAAVAEGKPAAA